MHRKEHWEHVYESKSPDRLGWYKPQLQTPLEWIRELRLVSDAAIIDVGGGASTLVDDLLGDGCQSISVLDISEAALAITKTRLGDKAERVTWLNGDITSTELPSHHYDLWHDRAVFHFLTETEQRRAYRDNLSRALKPGAHVIIGTFAPDAPPTCSGLPVQRYRPDQLADTLGEEFELQRHQKEMHVTPGGVEQMYVYCQFRRAVKPARD